MTKSLTQLISKSLLLPEDAAVYEISFRLAELFPGSYILETEDHNFDPLAYARDGNCLWAPLEPTHAQIQTVWHRSERTSTLEPRNAFCEILWRGKRLCCLNLTHGMSNPKRYYLIADDGECAHTFFDAVCAWNSEIHDEILVFGSGKWKRDKLLIEQIKRAKLENLVLADDLGQVLIADIAGFFGAGKMYEEIGVAWKRGILLLGPPGNGKTHFIKAMVNEIGKPCIYVRSFKPTRGTVQQAIEQVFGKARAAAPCMLILEDLDSLIDNANRSCFLNEMDGFAENNGILTIATTNHPQKLDPALIERPSRFDRKFTFSLPAAKERLEFLRKDNERRLPVAKMEESVLMEIADMTDGFSFAYLKELGLSSLMAWASDSSNGGPAGAMRRQTAILRKQMSSQVTPSSEEAKVESGKDDDD